MELNLALSSASNRINCSSCGQAEGNLLQGFDPRVQLRETRSSYFLDLNLPGLRKEDIWLQMDNARTLIIRGQRYLQDMGMVGWTWHLTESGGTRRRSRRFKIPADVNVGGVTASLHGGVLHVVMPKFRHSRFSPYHIKTRPRPHPSIQEQGPRALEAEKTVQEPQNQEAANGLCTDKIIVAMGEVDDEKDEKMQEIDAETAQNLFPAAGHPEAEDDEMSQVITAEVSASAGEECPSSEQPQRMLVVDLMEKEEEALCPSSSCDNPQEKLAQEEPMEEIDPVKCDSPRSNSEEEIIKEMTSNEVIKDASPSQASTVSNGDEKEGTTPPEEGKVERTIVGDGEEENLKAEECIGSEKAMLRKGLSHLLSSIAGVAARKWWRG